MFTNPSNNASLICQKVDTVCQCHCETNNIEKCDIFTANYRTDELCNIHHSLKFVSQINQDLKQVLYRPI